MRTPNKSQEDKQHRRRAEHYTPDTTSEESETLWQKLWQHPEKEEKPPTRHQLGEVRTMVSEKSVESKPISHAEEREQHIKRAEHITPYIPGPKWKGILYKVGQGILGKTGFKNKTLWDILSLQALVALALLFIQQSFSGQQAKTERERYLNNSLDSYITAMTDLMLKKDYNLNSSKTEKLGIQQAKTVGVLKILEGDREKQQRAIYFLRGSNLLGPKNQSGIFNKANLAELDLNGVELVNTDFRGADLRKAILNKVAMNRSDLTEANLGQAKLKGAYLYSVNLTGASLIEADLSNAILERAQLLCQQNKEGKKCANLTSANLEGANLTGTNLKGADLTEAKLRGANLEKADLTNAYHRAKLDLESPKIYLNNEYDDILQGTHLCNTVMSDGKLSSRDCPTNK